MDLVGISVLDHHAHPLLRAGETADAVGFRQWFTESTDREIHARHVPNTLFFQTGIRWLAALLVCEPTLERVLEARAAQNYETWVRRLFVDANIGLLLCDYGYGGEKALSHQEMVALLPCGVRPILRLETLAEQLILEQDSFEAMVEAFTAVLSQARANGFVAFKSIAAYRTGLAVEPPNRQEAAAAFNYWKQIAEQDGRIRLASRSLGDFLLWIALEQAAAQSLPVQFHTGFGDSDADLRGANPLWLRPLIEQTNAQVVLLHASWPFYRETAHLASIYPNVWLDLSLAIPFATSGIPDMLRAVLGMAPLSKIMFATDAFTMPEIYWLAARWGRWGLGRVLDEFIRDGFLTEYQARETAEMILDGNARGLYGL
ncbi:MAG: amidohydrolase family protein [Candidatus Promineifilaceae bacterium]